MHTFTMVVGSTDGNTFSMSVCLCVCVTFVVFTDCESCTRTISTNRDLWKRASMGKRVGGVSSRAVQRWPRSPGCCGFRGVFWVGRFFFVFFVFRFFFFFERTRPAASIRLSCLIFLSAINEAVFWLQGKKASSYRGACRVPLFN